MKVYDLKCPNGHAFEGWFDSLEELEDQVGQGVVSCPVCGEAKVRRVPSSFAIGGKASEPSHEMAAHMVGKALIKYLRENFEDVGSNFTNEALKIHYGASEPRNIRGVSTEAEEETLKNEGVSFFKVATPKGETAGDSEEEN
ncbi:MAG: DUF1178 family protein [Desulfarculaceae bacterium]|jgi:hypothetical protein